MSRTILLADDSLTIQKVVELTFADTDYEVVAVSSGDELLERLPECRPDIVICDVIMPGRDGYDVCQEIKSNAEFLHVPVILLTGTFEPFDRDRALAVGCSEIITKPFEARKLVEAIDRLSSAAAAAPSPATDEAALDVEVAPPPVEAPEQELTADAMELEDTVAGAHDEQSDTELVADSVEDGEVETSGEEGFPGESEGQAGFELALDEPAEEGEPPDLPDVGTPPDDQVFPESPDGAETVATQDFVEMVETAEAEVFAEAQPSDSSEEPFPAEDTDDGTFPDEGSEHEEPAAADESVDTSLTTPIDVEAVMAEETLEATEEAEETAAEAAEDDISDADTQDITEEVSTDQPHDEPAPAGLSDEDIDRIARRVLELAGDRIEHIAWDVIPDMAELVVRERIREIEAEVEHGRS